MAHDYLPCEMSVKFKPQDLWIGAFWRYRKSVESDYRRFEVWVCVLPMLPIYLNWEWGWRR